MISGVVVPVDPAVLGLLMTGSVLVGAFGSRLARNLRMLVQKPFRPEPADPLAGLFDPSTFAEALRCAEAHNRGPHLHDQRAMMAALRKFWAEERQAKAGDAYIVPAGNPAATSALPAPQSSKANSDARLTA
ncbi:MAG: hypothetical protein ACXIUO_02075 [Erythrobacter sp.]